MTSMASKVALFWMNLNFLWWTFTFAWKIELLKKPTGPDDSLCRRALMTHGGKGKKWPWIRVHVAPAINHHFISMNYSLAKLPTRNDSPIVLFCPLDVGPVLHNILNVRRLRLGLYSAFWRTLFAWAFANSGMWKKQKNKSRFVHHFFSVTKCD